MTRWLTHLAATWLAKRPRNDRALIKAKARQMLREMGKPIPEVLL